MNTALLRLSKHDLVKGVVVAVGVVFLGALQSALQGCALDFACYDWVAILDVTWKAAGAYLAKNLLTDRTGKVLGRI